MVSIPVKRLGNGFELPVYGLGLWKVGGERGAATSRDSHEIEAIQLAIEHGVTHIDTAEMYGKGHTEELLGAAIQGFDRRKLCIASKVWRTNMLYDALFRSCENTLKRIGTDYLDLYLLHFYPPLGVPIEDTMRAMNALVEQGMVKNIGICNVTSNRFRMAQTYTEHPLVCNQVHYNVEYREAERREILDFCQQNDVMLVAWQPLQKGMLATSPFLAGIAQKYDKTPAQVALNWLHSQKNVVTIVKASNSRHLVENLGAVGWELEQEDIDVIRRHFPDQKLVCDAAMPSHSIMRLT